MSILKLQMEYTARGRVFFNNTESVYPGWHLQYYEGTHLRTVRLHIQDTVPAKLALIEAAGFLGCRREQLQVEGDEWPSAVDAD